MPVEISSLDAKGRSPDYHQSALFLLFLGSSLLLLGLLLSQLVPPALVFGAIAIGLSCVVVPAKWPCGALLVLFVASVMPRISVEIGGWKARPEHCAAALVLFLFLFRLTSRGGEPIKLIATDYLVAAYVLWNYLSSALMSPDPRLTLRWALLNNLVVLPYFLVRFLVHDEQLLRWAFRAFLAVGVLECAYATSCFVSRHLLGTSFGTEVEQYAGGLGGVYGTQYEPNLLGSYAGCLAIIILVFYFVSTQKPRWLLSGLAVSVAALLVSLSRAAFLGLGLALIVLAFIGIRAGTIQTKKLLPIGLVIALLVTPFAATGGKDLVSRLTGLTASGFENDPEAMGRVVGWAAALENIARHPIAGNGTASFQLLADAKENPLLGERPWVGNSPVRIVHDTGVIGLLLIGAIAVGIARSIRNVYRRRLQTADMVTALVSGYLVYALAFLATEGTMLSFFWVHVGLLTSACAVQTRSSA